MDLSTRPSIPVIWLISKLNGKNCSTLSKPELKAERILAMVMLGHENICEIWPDVKLGYMGNFDKDGIYFPEIAKKVS